MTADSAKLAELLDQQPYGIAEFCSLSGKYIFSNEHERALRGLSPKEIQSVTIFDLFSESKGKELRQLFKQCSSSPNKETLYFKYNSNGQHFNMRLSRTSDGNISSTLTDTTSLCDLEQQRIEANESIKCLSDAVKGANIGCWDFYPQEGRIVANETWVTQKKYDDRDFRKDSSIFSDVKDGLSKWASLVHPDDLERTKKLIEKHLNGESSVYDAKFRMICGDGKWRWFHDLGRVFQRDETGEAIRMNGVHIDITASRNLELDIQKLAITDTLTGVLNRRNFQSLFKSTLQDSTRNHEFVCLLLIDIDNFKAYNDTYGHLEGDNVLESIGQTLIKNSRRKGDYCFRLGGEEFAVLFTEKSKASAIAFSKVIQNKIKALNIPHKNNTASPYVTVSLGLSCQQGCKEEDINNIYKQADDELYRAKDKGRNNLSINAGE